MANILADTSVLVEFFRPDGRKEVREEVGDLLERGDLALCGVVISELLQGVRPDEKGPLMELLRETHYLELARVDYEMAGELCNGLRRKGHKVPITDALIASVCIRLKIRIFTLDSHFNQFHGLEFHRF
jgi:predicted nucleic acid-binding protein